MFVCLRQSVSVALCRWELVCLHQRAFHSVAIAFACVECVTCLIGCNMNCRSLACIHAFFSFYRWFSPCRFVWLRRVASHWICPVLPAQGGRSVTDDRWRHLCKCLSSVRSLLVVSNTCVSPFDVFMNQLARPNRGLHMQTHARAHLNMYASVYMSWIHAYMLSMFTWMTYTHIHRQDIDRA